MDAEDSKLPCGGTYVLNGKQAVAYMRIRYVGNADYQRTQRQRDVLAKIFESLKGLDATELTKLANKILPCVEHDIDALEMIKLMALLPQLTGYELEESRIPYDDLITQRGRCWYRISMQRSAGYMRHCTVHSKERRNSVKRM